MGQPAEAAPGATSARKPIVLDEDSDEDEGDGTSQFKVGAGVRFKGLKAAAHLNGEIGSLVRFIVQKKRYEVALVLTDELKSVLPSNLEFLSVVEEVTLLRDRLTANGGLEAAPTRAVFRRLGLLPISTEVMQKTKIGKVVNDAAKRLARDEKVAELGRTLVKRWREAFQREQAPPARTPVAPAPARTTAVPAAPKAPAAPVAPANGLPDPKRPRLAEVSATLVPTPKPDVTAATPRPGPTTSKAAGSATNKEVAGLPPELAQFDSRIAKVLMDRPDILDFLNKHPLIMQNMSPEGLSFLTRNLKNSKDTQSNKSAGDGGTAGRSITIANLSPDATEDDVVSMFEGTGYSPETVTLPRESRRQRSCCVAFAVLSSREAVVTAMRELQGFLLRGRPIRLELTDGTAGAEVKGDARENAPPNGRRIAWKSEQELWDVALFDRRKSVVEFRDHIASASTSRTPLKVPTQTPEMSEQFQAEAKREREEERKMVRQALGSLPWASSR